MAGNSITRIVYHPDQRYHTVFNPRNGFFARIEDEDADEPEWSISGPELLDVSITNYCERCCNFCYRSSSEVGKHISIADYREVLSQAKEAGVFQIALGGGNPNQHPQFADILRITHEAGIVPSYTTNGDGLTDNILEATKCYCGAMALSAYPPFSILQERVKRIANHEIRLNLHIILSSFMIDKATEWLLDPPAWMEDINALIFLNYKPINQRFIGGKASEKQLKQFFEAARITRMKIGFDSCSISGILKWLDSPRDFLEACEAARFSAFISEDLMMYPCSFMANTDMRGDLRKESLLDIWRYNEFFNAMRQSKMRSGCRDCALKADCKGGCNFLPEINLCENKGQVQPNC